MIRTQVLAAVAILLAGAAFGHSGVKNAAVKARMDAMSAIGAETKVLGQMAQGKLALDIERARTAAARIAQHAAKTPALFEAEEDDPTSDARDEIWLSFDDFASKSERLESIAISLSESIDSKDDLIPAMKSLGKACRACHELYRE